MRARGTGSSFLRWRRENRGEQAPERGGDSPTGADGGIPGKGKGLLQEGQGDVRQTKCWPGELFPW